MYVLFSVPLTLDYLVVIKFLVTEKYQKIFERNLATLGTYLKNKIDILLATLLTGKNVL